MKKYLLLCLSLFLTCVNEPNEKTEDSCVPSDPNKVIEIVSPKTGDTFTVGDTVKVSFKVKTENVPQVVVKVKFNKLVFDAYNMPNEEFACVDTFWVIGKEHYAVDYSESDTVTLVIGEYNNPTDFGDSVSGIIIKNPQAKQ